MWTKPNSAELQKQRPCFSVLLLQVLEQPAPKQQLLGDRRHQDECQQRGDSSPPGLGVDQPVAPSQLVEASRPDLLNEVSNLRERQLHERPGDEAEGNDASD